MAQQIPTFTVTSQQALDRAAQLIGHLTIEKSFHEEVISQLQVLHADQVADEPQGGTDGHQGDPAPTE